MNFAFLAEVPSRELAPCDEWDEARWVTASDLAALPCPENVRQLAELALEIAAV